MNNSLVAHIGGSFIYSENPKELADWYHTYLGIPWEGAPDGSVYYATYFYNEIDSNKKACFVWSIIRTKNRPKTENKVYMINYRVNSMEKMKAHLHSLGIDIEPTVYPEGIFAHIHDSEGNEIELWEDTSMQ